MTPEELARLAEKRWLVRARTVRGSVARGVADAITVKESDVGFADRDTTRLVSDLFAERAKGAAVKEVPTRSAATRLAEAELSGIAGPAFLLPDRYDDCGVIPIDFEVAIEHVDALLASQQEIFRLVLATGDAGLCLFTQEGSRESYPRFVQLWKTTESDEGEGNTR
ncbi:MAG: hypothetical protein L0Z62_41425 [Gemmataceae bacterium]|nr:hypothetical protein [Gemmataceae bacterium]